MLRSTLVIMAAIAFALFGAAGCGSGSSTSPTSSAESTATLKPTPRSKGDNSIQEYGSAASGAKAGPPIAAMHSFLSALAGSDYARICAGLAASNVEELSGLSEKGCPDAIKRLNLRAAATSAAKAAARAPVKSVRIQGDTAFVLFTPAGGEPSFFVMKEENGSWKATSLGPGTPLHP
jgi:hypothetical protein